MKKFLSSFVTAAFLFVSLTRMTTSGRAATVQSPDGLIRTEISTNATGHLQYRVWRGSETVIEPSPLGITIDGADWGEVVSLGESDTSHETTYFPGRGGHAIVTNSYLQSTAADLIRSIPSVWDETLVLPGSEIGKLAAFARRLGENWYVGILNAGPDRSCDLDLKFLGPADRDGVFASDHPDLPDELLLTHGHFRGNETLHLDLKSGGGWVGRFTLRK